MGEILEEIKTKVVLPVFEYSINVIFTNNIQKSVNKVDKILKRELQIVGPGVKAMHIKVGGRPISFIIFPIECGINSIVHESFHSICSLMRWVSAEPEEEIVAYHLDHIVGEIVKFYNKKVLDKGKNK